MVCRPKGGNNGAHLFANSKASGGPKLSAINQLIHISRQESYTLPPLSECPGTRENF